MGDRNVLKERKKYKSIGVDEPDNYLFGIQPLKLPYLSFPKILFNRPTSDTKFITFEHHNTDIGPTLICSKNVDFSDN